MTAMVDSNISDNMQTFFSMTILPPDVSWTEYVGMLIGLTFVTMAVVFGWKNTKRTFAWMLAIYQRHRI